MFSSYCSVPETISKLQLRWDFVAMKFKMFSSCSCVQKVFKNCGLNSVLMSDTQLIAEENQVRLELQMALDSKDSDIEQLRCQITSLSVHSLDSTSISSGNELDMGEGYPGRWRILSPSLNVLYAVTHIELQPVSEYTSACTSCAPLYPVSIPEFLLFPLFILWAPFVFQANCFWPFSSLCFFLFPPPHLTSLPLRGPAQCALLTPTCPNQCPSPTSAHTNPSASTPDPTFTRLTLSLTLTLRMRKSVTGSWSRASIPWPSPTISPLRLNLQVTLHGGSNQGWGQNTVISREIMEKKKPQPWFNLASVS